MARAHRTVRVDADLLDEVEGLARQRLVPVTLSEQVEAGLRLLAYQAGEQQTRHAAGLVGADRRRAHDTAARRAPTEAADFLGVSRPYLMGAEGP